MENTLKPVPEPFPAEIRDILASYPQQDGYILALFRTFANSARFLRKGVPNLLDRDSPLDLRTREIVILRTTANRNCEYEWGVHVAIFSKAAGFSEAQVRATCLPDPDSWPPRERRLLAVIDQLCADGRLDADRLQHLRQDWSTEQQLEIAALIGAYSTVSCVANIAELDREPFTARFPAGFVAGQPTARETR